MQSVYSLKELEKCWFSNDNTFTLKVPSLIINEGEMLAVTGVSGSGKSTLLDILALTLSPTKTESFSLIYNNGIDVDIALAWAKNRVNQLTVLRRENIGYVLQTGGLLPYINVRKNIFLIRNLLKLQDDGLVDLLVKRLGIETQLNKFPNELSAGQRQRVAIARALAHQPRIVIADEPTASVDPISADIIMNIFCELVDEFNITAIIATHDWGRVQKMGIRCIKAKLKQSNNGSVATFLG